ncbi:hypothetical protein HanRHA438_Chr07g0296651 [Helianthus annuus]|nr:hypothetical protein HanRHA438_Chr07g0296651 [Helianthus annuus]
MFSENRSQRLRLSTSRRLERPTSQVQIMWGFVMGQRSCWQSGVVGNRVAEV